MDDAIDTSPERVRNSAENVHEPVGHLYTIAGIQHCTIEKVLEDGPLYTAPPDTEAMRKELDDARKMIAGLEAANGGPYFGHYQQALGKIAGLECRLKDAVDKLERVKGERDAYRAFIYNLSGSAGGMVNGNRLSISANKVLGFGEVCGKQPEGTPPTNPAESVNCCPGSPGWPVALRDSTIDTITDACFQAVADQGTTVLMRAVARAVERQHGIAAQGEGT